MPCPTCAVYPNDNETGDGHDCDQLTGPTGPAVEPGHAPITPEQSAADQRSVGRLFQLSDGISALYLLLCVAQMVCLALYVSARIHFWQDPSDAALATDNSRNHLMQHLQPVLVVGFWAFMLTRVFATRGAVNALRRHGADLTRQAGKHWSSYLELGAYLVVILCGILSPRMATLNGMDPATAVATLQHYRQNAFLDLGLRVAALAALLVSSRIRRGRTLALLLTGRAPSAPDRAVTPVS